MSAAMSDDAAVLQRLTVIETKLDVALTQHGDHETRIRRLERALYLVSGAAAVGGGLVSRLLGA